MDDRICAVAILLAAKMMETAHKDRSCDVIFSFSSAEEVNGTGGEVLGKLMCDGAVVLDVNFGRDKDIHEKESYVLGDGCGVSYSCTTSRTLTDALVSCAKKADIPVRISHSHNTVTRFDFKWPIKILYKYLLRLVATDYVACGIDAGKYLFGKEVKVIHNAIDVDKFKFNGKARNKLRKELNIENKFVIGHVGRFEPQKNHNFLIDVFYEYQKRDNDAVLLLIGNGSLEDKIKEKVKQLDIQDKVKFTGSISNVNEMYSAMDLFILPSFHEGLPVVGVEAQMSGVTCVFSDNVTKEVKFNENVFYISLNDKICIDVELNNGPFNEITNFRNELYASKLFSLMVEKGVDVRDIKDRQFIQLNLNTKDLTVEHGNDVLVTYGLVSKKVYIKNKKTFLKYHAYYREKYYTLNEK